MQLLIKQILLTCLLYLFVFSAAATVGSANEQITIDRIQLVNQQINLLDNRLAKDQRELNELQQNHDKQITGVSAGKVSKSLLDKALLDITVAKASLDSVNIELTDTQQTISWLEKSIQEIENQINVLNIFGRTIAEDEINNSDELRVDAKYQQELLSLEKKRYELLKDLQFSGKNILMLKNEKHAQLNTLMKSRNLLFVKQQQVKDELLREQQNYWLQQLDTYNARLAFLDPSNPGQNIPQWAGYLL